MSIKTKAVLASGILAVSAFILIASIVGIGPHCELTPHRALGKRLAKEALGLRGSNGRLIVLARDTASHRNPYSDAQLSSFRKTIGRSGGVIDRIVLLRINPIRLVALPAGDFLGIANKLSDQDVVVSFVGPPVLSEDQLRKLGGTPPKVLAVCSGGLPRQVNLRKLFEQKLLTMAIVSRPDPAPQPGIGADRAFDHFFSLVTAANSSDLPLVASSEERR